ncbi:MAG: triple tyrosine motif-containing protein [Clostridium butyricum]|nr:triple tyrosine motif-containing protein [Clostridium butyricum]
MKGLQLKYMEIIFDKEKPQNVGTDIKIIAKAENDTNLDYKFIVGKGGVWTAIQEFSKKNECIWTPSDDGDYIIMVQARERNKLKPIDYLAKEDYSIVKRGVKDGMDKNIENKKTSYDSIKNIEQNITAPENSKDNAIDDFKDFIENKEKDNSILFLEAASITADEKKELMQEISKAKDEVAVSKETVDLSNYNLKVLDNKSKEKVYITDMDTTKDNIENIQHNKKLLTVNNDNHIIDKIELDNDEIIVGDKCTINVKTSKQGQFLYRFYIKNGNDWNIIRDYESISELKYTANDSGKKEFLIQCKRIDSIENFDDFKIININVKEREKLQITNIACVSDELIAGEELKFIVNINFENNEDNKDDNKDDTIPLYKFYKIYKNGKSVCLQDYSTKNEVEYVEQHSGEYRILCLVKTVFSNNEYDDRAILVYNVKPYRDIKINSFVADLNSPQASETDIRFTPKVEGGNKILYRYKIKGPIESDTDYVESPEFIWNPKEAGEYEINLFVKNFDYDGEYEDTSKIAFTIEKRGKNPIKILDVVVDKEKKIIVNEPVNIMVNAEGGTGLLYSFIVRKDAEELKKIDYNKHNFIDFTPKEIGNYEVEVWVKDKYSNKKYDVNTILYLKCLEYMPGEIDYIILPCKETYLIGDTIEFECIIQNTPEVLVRYETKINGHAIEETEFSTKKKLRFTPKIAGKYTIEVYAKNIKCQKEYDSKKQVNIYINEALPVISTKIIPNTLEPVVNEEFTIEAKSRGGKDVCYEFYLMENNTWKKVQAYSRKKFYSFIPFTSGRYKILVLAKSYYKKVNYEDYAEISFDVKELKKMDENN